MIKEKVRKFANEYLTQTKSQGLLKNINFCSIVNVTSEKRYLIIVLQTKKPRVAARGFFYSFFAR